MSEAYPYSPDYLETLREGDTGLGLPDFVPQEVRRLTVLETQQHEKQREEDWRSQFERKLAELEAANASNFQLPAGVRSFMAAAVLLGVCFLSLLLITQMLDAAANLKSLPTGARWAVGSVVTLIGGVVAYYLGRMGMLFFRLKTQQQLNIRALNILAERRQMQALAEEKSRDARRLFTSYLRDYPVDREPLEKFAALGLDAESVIKLRAARERLLNVEYAETSKQWLDEYRDSFQSVLDEAAKARVWNYALKAGVATSTSPYPLLDQAIVLYTCTSMIGDLMKLYNIRPALGQTGVILGQAILHAYLVGVFDDAANTAANTMSETLKGMAHTGPEMVGLRAAKFVSAKLAEGTINGMLVRRLGRQTVRMLQPMREN